MSDSDPYHLQAIAPTQTALGFLSIAINIFILGSTAWIYSRPSARHHIQRVSYWLICWTLGAQILYSVVRSCLYTDSSLDSWILRDRALCTSGVYFFFKEMHLVNFLTTCIAVNLMLIVCFGINPIEKKLLRWYVGVSFGTATFLPLIPAALGHFGFDNLYQTCYIVPYEIQPRLIAVIFDVVLWQVLSCIVATGSVIAVLICLFRSGRATTKALLQGHASNRTPYYAQSKSSSRWSLFSKSRSNSEASTAAASPESRTIQFPDADMNHLSHRLSSIALRISLYPISLIIVNSFISTADIYFNVHLRNGVDGKDSIFLWCYLLMYAGRGLFLSLIVIIADPSFQRGFAAAWRATRQRREINPINGGIMNTQDIEKELSFEDMLSSPNPNFAMFNSGSRSNSTVEVDLDNALKSLPYTRPLTTPRPVQQTSISPERIGAKSKNGNTSNHLAAFFATRTSNITGTTSDNTHKSKQSPYSKKFNGVRSESLPEAMSDDVDVDLRLSYLPSRSASRGKPCFVNADTDEKDPEEIDTIPVLENQDLQRIPKQDAIGMRATRTVEVQRVEKREATKQALIIETNGLGNGMEVVTGESAASGGVIWWPTGQRMPRISGDQIRERPREDSVERRFYELNAQL